jgi:hypothetical protein
VQRIAAGPGPDVDDFNFDHIAGLRPAHVDGAGADMHPEPFARAAPEHRGVHRSGSAPVDVLAFTRPAEDAFGTGIPRHHPIPVVAGMLGERLDRDGCPRLDPQHRRQRATDIAPVYRVGGRRQVMPITGPWLRLGPRCLLRPGRRSFRGRYRLVRRRPATLGVAVIDRHGGAAHLRGGHAESRAEGAAEMRLIPKTPALADGGNAFACVVRIEQVHLAALQPQLPYMVGEILAPPFEQPLQVACRHPLLAGDIGEPQIGVGELAVSPTSA